MDDVVKAWKIARVCHEANRAYCASIGDTSQKPWDEAPEWQRTSAYNVVEFTINNPDAPPSAQHDAWMQDKFASGWRHGPVKDPEKKEHPSLVPYDILSEEERKKDTLFRAVVAALK